MVADCRRKAPAEACGILGGKDHRVKSVLPLTNIASDRQRRYEVDPEEQAAVMEKIWGEGDGLVGIYHSHPNSKAYPSETDLEMAFYPEAFYVIVSLAQPAGRDPDIRCYQLPPSPKLNQASGCIIEVPVVVDEDH